MLVVGSVSNKYKIYYKFLLTWNWKFACEFDMNKLHLNQNSNCQKAWHFSLKSKIYDLSQTLNFKFLTFMILLLVQLDEVKLIYDVEYRIYCTSTVHVFECPNILLCYTFCLEALLYQPQTHCNTQVKVLQILILYEVGSVLLSAKCMRLQISSINTIVWQRDYLISLTTTICLFSFCKESHHARVICVYVTIM